MNVKEKYFIDLSKCKEEEQKHIFSLLPKPIKFGDFIINEYHSYLHFDNTLTYPRWYVDYDYYKKQELTYPEFIKLFEGGEGETIFKNYIENQREAFVCFISENYTVDKHLQLRTEIDSLLIAYDQMQNKLNSNQ